MLEKDPSRSEIPVVEYFTRTYFTLRFTIAVIALILPAALIFWTLVDPDLRLLNSMSAYYYGPTRNIFVGALIATGVCLICYKGFSTGEDWLLNLAGILAVMVALFPTQSKSGKVPAIQFIHTASALAFFFVIALTIWIYSRVTLPALRNQEKEQRYRAFYRFLSVAIVLAPVAAAAVIIVAKIPALVFTLEAAGIYVFAAYWLVKTHELSNSGVEPKVFTNLQPDKKYSDL